MNKQKIKELRKLVDELMFSHTKADGEQLVKKLNFAVASLASKIPINAVHKFGEVIGYATEASGQSKNKDHWISCVNSSWYVFESLVSNGVDLKVSLPVFYSKASREDFPAILELQGRNLLGNLTERQRENGFLTVEFTSEMLEEVIEDLLIVKAFTEKELVGYWMAQTLEFNIRFPLVSAIINRFPNINFMGQKLSEAKVFITGPCCISEGWRGRGIYERMFKESISLGLDRFDVGVTFIANSNPRSLVAAQKKLGMRLVEQMTFNGKDYSILAFLTKAKA